MGSIMRIAATLLVIVVLPSCRGGVRGNPSSREASSGGAISPTGPDGGWTKEQIAKLMSNPVIDIQPVSAGSTFAIRFRIKERPPGQDVPLVNWVAISNPNDSTFNCDLRSEDFVPLSEWKYGEVPQGFTKSGCGPLAVGEYDIYATGLGPRGTGRMKLDEKGAVSRLPWYEKEVRAGGEH